MSAVIRFKPNLNLEEQKACIERNGGQFVNVVSDHEVAVVCSDYSIYRKLAKEDNIISIDFASKEKLQACVQRSGNQATIHLE